MSVKKVERIRWRARRGLLELDILLERFITKCYLQLDARDQRLFEDLLDMPDNELWDMIAGRMEATQLDHRALLEKIRSV